MAEQLQSMGRDEDSMLVHMTPGEVNSLQGLAMAAGGSLTINPNTGLPEAGFLKKLLPMLAGVGLNFILPGSGLVASLGGKAATAGLLTGAASTALTGSLQKGLMAGLGAFGGASLAGGVEGALSGASKALPASAPSTVLGPAGPMSTAALPAGIPGATAGAAKTGVPGFFQGFGNTAKGSMTGLAGKAAAPLAASSVLNTLSEATAPKMPTYKAEEDKFKYVPMRPLQRQARFQTPEQMRESGGAEFSYFTPSNPEPVPFAEGGPVDAAMPDFQTLVNTYQAQNPGAITASMYPLPSNMPAANAPTTPSAPAAGILPPRAGETVHSFNRPSSLPSAGGLGSLTPRQTMFSGLARRLAASGRPTSSTAGGGFSGFAGFGPNDHNNLGLAVFPQQFADGGAVDMGDGSFVVDARTVSELGNGSSNAGIEMLSRMGGRPVRGPGDGVSDSVKASIGGKQEARVARDEVIFSPEAVRRIGGGSEKRGTQKLYAMMDKAHKARKKAKRGQDTGLRRGLA
jgi:hypothetical protein